MSEDNPAVDDATVEGNPSGHAIEENLKSRATWMRCLFMLISCVFLTIASLVGTVVVVLGFFWVLFSGETNRQVQQVGQSIASYVYEIIRYLTFNSDDKPFPLGGEWPSAGKD